MKKIVTLTMALAMLAPINLMVAETSSPVGEVKSSFSALFTLDNDGDGINDYNDLCKDQPMTPTFSDDNLDGCDDATQAMLDNAEATKETIIQEEIAKDGKKKEEDVDGDGISNDEDGCVKYAPTVDTNNNGCEDDTIRTMYIDSEVQEVESVNSTANGNNGNGNGNEEGETTTENALIFTGVAFVDNQEFASRGTYTTEVEFHNLETGEFMGGEVATGYCDAGTTTQIVGVDENIGCAMFTISLPESFFSEFTMKNGLGYSVDITLTDANGTKYSETLYSFEDFNGNNSEFARVASNDGRVSVSFK